MAGDDVIIRRRSGVSSLVANFETSNENDAVEETRSPVRRKSYNNIHLNKVSIESPNRTMSYKNVHLNKVPTLSPPRNPVRAMSYNNIYLNKAPSPHAGSPARGVKISSKFSASTVLPMSPLKPISRDHLKPVLESPFNSPKKGDFKTKISKFNTGGPVHKNVSSDGSGVFKIDQGLMKCKVFRVKYDNAATVIQSLWRGHRVQRKWKKERLNLIRYKAAKKIQSRCRIFLALKVYEQHKEKKRLNVAATKIQSLYHIIIAFKRVEEQKKYLFLCKKASVIQARYRGIAGRNYYREYRLSRYATKIQCCIRVYLAKLDYQMKFFMKKLTDIETTKEKELHSIQHKKQKKFNKIKEEEENILMQMSKYNELEETKRTLKEEEHELYAEISNVTLEYRVLERTIQRLESNQSANENVYLVKKSNMGRDEDRCKRLSQQCESLENEISTLEKKINKRIRKQEKEQTHKEKIQNIISNIKSTFQQRYPYPDDDLYNEILNLCSRQ